MKKKSIFVIVFAILTIIVMALALTGVIDETLGMCIALTMTVIFNLIVAIMAYKSDIKVVTVIMTIFMIVGVVLLGINLYHAMKNEESDTEKFQIKVKADNSPKMSVFSHNNHNYYTYNLSEVTVTMRDDEKSYALKDALQEGHVTLDEILSLAIPNDNTKGYKIYYDGGDNTANTKYSIIVCENSKDIIFSTYSYEYAESICQTNALG